jgi:hypothetical protein
MNEQRIRAYFAPNWVFRLYLQRSIPYLAITIAVPITIWLAGAICALIIGVFPLYAGNILAYYPPIMIGLGFAAYGWYAATFPKMLEVLYTILETTHGQFGGIVKKWTDCLGNRLWLMILASILIAVPTLNDTITLWNTPSLQWLGTEWIQSPQSTFFAIYYGFNVVLVASFMLGSGAVGVLGSVLLLREVLRLPLRLAHYREMHVVGDFSVGLALWTFVSVTAVIILPVIFKPQSTAGLVATTIFQSILASAALLAGLLLPIIFARKSIIHAKSRQLAGLAEAQHSTYTLIERLTRDLATEKDSTGSSPKFDQLRQQLEHLETMDKLILEIETIPNWPITWRGAVQILGAALVPVWGTLVDTLLPKILPK